MINLQKQLIFLHNHLLPGSLVASINADIQTTKKTDRQTDTIGMYANKQITCFPMRRKMENTCVFRKKERECVSERERGGERKMKT